MNKIMLIDFNALHFKYCFGYKKLTFNDKPVGGIYGWFKNIFYNAERFDIDNIIFVLDGRKSKHSKRIIFPEYKLNRPKIIDMGLFDQYKFMLEILKDLEIKVLNYEDFEADEVIALFSQKLSIDNKVLILTNDKDYLQLIKENVSILMLYPFETVLFNNREEVFNRIGIYPEQVVDFLSISGDSSDNIPGIPSIGPITTKKLLKQYGNLENIYNNLTELKIKHQDLFNSYKEELKIYNKMIDLSNVIVNINWVEVNEYLIQTNVSDFKRKCLAKKTFVNKMTDIGINIWKL